MKTPQLLSSHCELYHFSVPGLLKWREKHEVSVYSSEARLYAVASTMAPYWLGNWGKRKRRQFRKGTVCESDRKARKNKGQSSEQLG